MENKTKREQLLEVLANTLNDKSRINQTILSTNVKPLDEFFKELAEGVDADSKVTLDIQSIRDLQEAIFSVEKAREEIEMALVVLAISSEQMKSVLLSAGINGITKNSKKEILK